MDVSVCTDGHFAHCALSALLATVYQSFLTVISLVPYTVAALCLPACLCVPSSGHNTFHSLFWWSPMVVVAVSVSGNPLLS